MSRKEACGFVLLLKSFLVCVFITSSASCLPASKQSFTIDYEHNTFLKDGKPFRYISGSIHYFRIPYQNWADRLQKMRYAGLNAVQVYVAWNVHETEPGVYNFDGQQDLEGFIKLAQDNGLLVILRPGPYICAEWEFGGFPYWLIRENASVVLRSEDPQYITPVKRWLDVLLPKMKPLLYENGGPIITVQVENEFGSYYTCDRQYTSFLRDYFISHLGSTVTLFTTDGDGAGYLRCGVIKGVYATVDFGPGNATQAFKSQRAVEPKGPLVNSEYYVGWLDHWGQRHSQTAWQTAVKTLDEMLTLGANVNMYMFEGGTNFGYMNGANYAPYQPQPTSYDYDAPLSEAGDMTYKFTAIKETIEKHMNNSKVSPIPTNSTKEAYGPVKMTKVATLLDSLDILSKTPVSSPYPLPMEKINQAYGYVLYRTTLNTNVNNAQLSAPGVKDRAYVLVNGLVLGILDRTGNLSLQVSGLKGQCLDIIVENQGRINYGKMLMNNIKGLTSNVTLAGIGVLEGWMIYSLDLSQAAKMNYDSSLKQKGQGHMASGTAPPAIYRGSFLVSEVADTFLNTDGWSKGQAFINGFNLGRYWPTAGPQITLYVPAAVLKAGKNTVTLVEFENSLCDAWNDGTCAVFFTKTPFLNGPTKSILKTEDEIDWHKWH